MARQWSDDTKRWVVTAGAVLGGLALVAMRNVITPFVLGAVLAYILFPVSNALHRLTRLPYTLAAALIYLLLLLNLVLLPATLVPGVIHQISTINVDLNSIVNAIRDLAGRYQTIEILGFPVDLTPVYQQLIASITGLVTTVVPRSLNAFTAFASGFASTLIGLILTLVVSFYLTKDAHRIGRYLDNLAPADYRDAVALLRHEVGQIWDAFFRGQLLLCLVIGVATGSALWLVGVRQALMLGLLAGVLEIIPNLGPVLAAVPAVLLALLQGSTRLSISPMWFALLVAGLYVVIQQVENNYLVPRIIGSSVKLHPVVVLLGVVAGASLAGVLGIFLAAPMLATVRVVARYCYDKLQDKPILPPAPQPAKKETRRPAPQPSVGAAPAEAADAEGTAPL